MAVGIEPYVTLAQEKRKKRRLFCKDHHGKDAQCARCATQRCWAVYVKWCDLTVELPKTLSEAHNIIDAGILYELREALDGPKKKPKSRKPPRKKTKTNKQHVIENNSLIVSELIEEINEKIQPHGYDLEEFAMTQHADIHEDLKTLHLMYADDLREILQIKEGHYYDS